MVRAILQYNQSAREAPSGRRYLSVIIERIEQDERGVWGLPTLVEEVASFPVDARWPSGNPWSPTIRRPADHFMWARERAAA